MIKVLIMARARYTLTKGEKKYRVISFDKKEQTVKLQGEFCEFETGLEKALATGYRLVKNN